jgi:hypothetical protein
MRLALFRRRVAATAAAALVVAASTFTAATAPAEAGTARARPAATAASAGTPATTDAAATSARAPIDQSMPMSWPRWRFWTGQGGRLSMDAAFSGGHGARLQIWGENGGDAQLWAQEDAAEGGAYLHPGYNRWLCLGVNTTGWGSAVYVQNCNGSAKQRWHVSYGPFVGYEIRNVVENLCIDVPSSNFTSGQALQIWGCNHGEAQRWQQLTPLRNDSKNEPVYFVPGHTSAIGHNCTGDYWGEAISTLRSQGFTGNFHTIGFYANDVNCSDQIGRHDRGTGLEIIGRELAWDIFEYSVRGVSVDIVSHSMGGLIARAAVYGTQAHWEGYPPFLYVEDVVTLSTPHLGINFTLNVAFCGTVVQCVQMREGSDFLGRLGQNPQSQQGTDWTLIASDDDGVVRTWTALGMSAGHLVNYPCCQGLSHSTIHKARTGAWRQDYWNYYDGWHYITNGASPVVTAVNALYRYSAF